MFFSFSKKPFLFTNGKSITLCSRFLFKTLICEEEPHHQTKNRKKYSIIEKLFLCSFDLKLEVLVKQKKIVKRNLTGRIRTIDLGIPIDRLLQSPALPTELR